MITQKACPSCGNIYTRDQVRALLVEMRRYIQHHGLLLGECVAWNKLKAMHNVGVDDEAERKWSASYLKRQPVKSLTDRQKEIFDYIVEFTGSNRYGVSVRDIMRAFDYRSPNGAMCHLDSLRSKGMITWQPGIPRSIVPMEREPTLTLAEALSVVNAAAARQEGGAYELYREIELRLKEVAK